MFRAECLLTDVPPGNRSRLRLMMVLSMAAFGSS